MRIAIVAVYSIYESVWQPTSRLRKPRQNSFLRSHRLTRTIIVFNKVNDFYHDTTARENKGEANCRKERLLGWRICQQTRASIRV